MLLFLLVLAMAHMPERLSKQMFLHSQVCPDDIAVARRRIPAASISQCMELDCIPHRRGQ